jgi:integrase
MIKRLRQPGARASKTQRKLTESNVRSLRPRASQYLTWDDPAGKDAAYGLAVLTSPRGVKSYRCVFYYPGSSKPHYKYLGRVGEVSLEEAREATRRTRRMARDGEDPLGGEASRSDSFLSVVDAYVAHELVGNRGNKASDETRNVILSRTQAWASRPVATIRPGEIEKLLWEVRDGGGDRRGTPYMANRIFIHLRDLLKWAARPGGQLKTSPMSDMRKPWAGEKRRDLPWFHGQAADDLVARLWAEANAIGGVRGRYTKVMILTGKRKTSVREMRWEQISEDGVWTPPEGSKNKRAHAVPLSQLALRQLGPRREAGEVFAGVGDVDLLMRSLKKRLDMPGFIWHGLKHIAISKTAELGVPPHLQSRLFDHADGAASTTQRVYDHHTYVSEMREGIECWAQHVERLVTPEGVAVLR